MYKNLLKSIAFAALAIVAGACAKEQVASGDGETVEMTFNVDVPETTITTKGLSDAAQVDELIFDAFRNQNDTESIKGLRQVVAVENGRATIQVKLVKGQNYRFVFWAQKANNGYYNTDNLSNITVDYSNALANDSSLDAFFAKEEVTNVQNPISKTIILKRPFAQVNFVTKEKLSEGLYIKESQITVKNALTSFNPLRNKLSGAKDVTFDYNAIPAEKLIIGGIEYNYLATAFILAKSDNSKDIVDVEAKFKANKGYSVTVSTPGLPCKRNYRTNVIGNFMSVDGTYNVEIDSAFKGDFQSDYVENALSSGQVVTLTEDYSLPEGSEGVAVPSGKTSVLNLNGKRFVNESGTINDKSALIVRGKLTINGEGEVYCEGGTGNNSAIMVDDNGELIINGGTYNVATDKSGKCNSTIYAISATCKIEINGGVFMNEEGSNGHAFVLNQLDDITVNCFSVKGGTFVGFNPANVNENNGSITSFVADGYMAVETTYNGKQAWEVKAIPVVGTQERFAEEIVKPNTSVILSAGTYDMPSTIADGVTIIGNGEGTVLDMELKNTTCKNATFKNVKILCEATTNYKGFIGSDNTVFENCTFTGKHFSYGKETYKKCHFIQEASDYNMWVYGKDVDYIDCTFEGKGKLLHVYNEGNPHITVNIQGCKFISTVLGKPAINIKGTCGAIALDYTINIDNCTVSGEFPANNDGLWQVDKPATAENNKITVNVDGEKVYLK